MSRPDKSLRTALYLLAAWLVTFIGFWWLVTEYRDSASVSVLGHTYTGSTAALIVMVYAALPVALLAVAIQKLYQYRRGKSP